MDSVNNEPFDFSFQLPSLKELTLIRIARILWRTPEMIKSLDRSNEDNTLVRYSNYRDEPTEKELLKKISLLPLPEHLKKQVIPLVYHVGRELKECNYLYLEVFDELDDCELSRNWFHKIENDFLTSDRIRWSAYGTVDTDQMARMIVRHPDLPIKNRYYFACQLCFEDVIQRLWTEMEPKEREAMKNKMSDVSVSTLLTVYWSLKMAKETWNYSESPEDMMVRLIFKWCSTFNFGYSLFWPKLTDAQKKCVREQMKSWDKGIFLVYFEKTIFLLNTIDRQQQVELLLENLDAFLPILLKRPWQHLFFPILDVLKKHFDAHSFSDFFGRADLSECDDSMRCKFYSVLRPFTNIYLNEIFEKFVSSYVCFYSEHVKKLMMDVPLSQKCDLISQVLPQIWPKTSIISSGFIRVKFLVLEWFTSDTWSAHRNLLIRNIGKEELENIKDFLEYFDDHFSNLSVNEVNGSVHSSKRLKIGD